VTEIFLNVFRSRLFLPKSLFVFGLGVISWIKHWRGRSLTIDRSRFISANWPHWIKIKKVEISVTQYPIEIVIVSTRKDFETLPTAIKYATRSLAVFNEVNVKVIVPPGDLVDCKSLVLSLVDNISVISEQDVIELEVLEILNEVFESRATWVYQQLLKTWHVKNSTSDYVLILDSDTILLRPRRWISSDGRQILMPSDEFNADYYLFLNKMGICSSDPVHSFITHHMIMQPKIVREILRRYSFDNVAVFVKYICENANLKTHSPICVDYELYGQYLFSHKKKSFFIEKWKNIGISRSFFTSIMESDIKIYFLKTLYDSVSFHSWSIKPGG
jgi:hypothetical protein